MPRKATPSLDDLIEGTYTIYIQIKRPDGVRCGFTHTVDIYRSEKLISLARAKTIFRAAVGKAVQAVRGKAPEILTTPVKKITVDRQ